MKIQIFCFIVLVLGSGCTHGADVVLQINHWNDISSQLERFEPLNHTKDLPKPCTTSANEPNKCIGGFQYVINAISERSKDPDILDTNFLKLTSGNLVGGESGWLSVVGWKEFGYLLRDFYRPTHMSLGIKEFGAGLSRTNDYLISANTTFTKTSVILSNIKNCDQFSGNKPEVIFCNQIIKSEVVAVKATNGDLVNIGIVGFVNPNVEKLGAPGDLEFDDVITGLRDPIQNLKNQGVKFIIALGDGTLTMSKSIIDTYGEVKVVIYGRGFGSPIDMTGNYPEQYKSSYIGTAGSYGTSVGKMIVQFDSDTGNIKSTSRSRLLPIDEKAIGDNSTEISSRLTALKGKVEPLTKNLLGRTHVTIHGGEVCWKNECNLGNIMADAAVHCAFQKDVSHFDIPEGQVLGIWHGGALFYDNVPQKHQISELDVHKWLPYHNNVHVVAIKGSSLKLLFEASATALDTDNTRKPKWGQFLQISGGMEVTYSTSGGQGKLEKIRVVKDTDTIPKMQEITDDDRFLLAMPSFLREGRSIFDFVKEHNFFVNIPTVESGYYHIGFDDECLTNYTKGLNGLTTGFEERIYIDVNDGPGNPKCKNNTAKHVLLTLFITLLVLGGVFVGWKFILPRFNGPYQYQSN